MKLKSLTLLWTLMVSMTAFGTVEERLTSEQIMEIEEQRLSYMPKDLIEQATPKLSYYNDDQYLDRIHKLAYTFPYALIDEGVKIDLIDGSRWYVNPVQRDMLWNWSQSHTIFIKPKSSCFSMYPYVLYNRTTRQAVEVQFINMPYEYGPYRQRIAKIDPYNRIVQLDDYERTVWQISYSDTGFNHWKVGDFVIVGVNNDWRIATHPHILINTSMISTPYCEGSFYGYGL